MALKSSLLFKGVGWQGTQEDISGRHIRDPTWHTHLPAGEERLREVAESAGPESASLGSICRSADSPRTEIVFILPVTQIFVE